MSTIRRGLFWISLALGAVGLFLAGQVEEAGIALIILAILMAIAARPFIRWPPRRRLLARIGATGLVVVGWMLAGMLHWDWGPGDWAVATVIAVVAIGRAATPRE